MKSRHLGLMVLGLLAAACGGGSSEQEAMEPTTAEPSSVEGWEEPKPVAEPAPPELTEEEQKLLDDRAKAQAAHEAEVARLTPEVLAEAKALAEKSYPNGRAAIKAAMASKHRQPNHPERDAARHPAETLQFFGFAPNQTVLEWGSGAGWYTELLAPALAKKGKLLITMNDPNGPKTERATLYGERVKLFLERAPDLYGKIEPIVIDPKAPDLNLAGTVDLILAIRELHGLVNQGRLPAVLAEFHAALKPKGVLGIVQHRAKPDADPLESSKKGYVPEKWLIEQVEAAGFKLAKKSEINANPKDTADHAEGVWALPPNLRVPEADREKYAAIGESDRMTLKFVKVAKKD